MKNAKLALVAALGLALAFTFSCSSDDSSGGGGGDYYNPNSEDYRCRSGIVEYKCGDVWMNTTKYTCFNNEPVTFEQFYVRCGNGYYLPASSDNSRCQSGVLEYKCGNVWYDGTKYFCSINNEVINLAQWYEQNGYVRCK